MALSNSATSPQKFRLSSLQTLALLGFVVLATIILTAWWMNRNIYAAPFTPTQLTPAEQLALDSKLAHLTDVPDQTPTSPIAQKAATDHHPLQPEPYQEDDKKREIRLSEKELNALIANDPETAQYVAIDLAHDLVSVKLLVPMDKDFPVFGGKTLRLNLGVVFKYTNHKPVVAIRGISLGGVPLPQSWWGDIKNVNLVEKFGAEGGFWDQFAQGVENIDVQEGQLRMKLKE